MVKLTSPLFSFSLPLRKSTIANLKIGSAFGSGLNLLSTEMTLKLNKIIHEMHINECEQNTQILKVPFTIIDIVYVNLLILFYTFMLILFFVNIRKRT